MEVTRLDFRHQSATLNNAADYVDASASALPEQSLRFAFDLEDGENLDVVEVEWEGAVVATFDAGGNYQRESKLVNGKW